MKQRLDALLANKGLMSGSEWRRQAEDLARRRAAGEFEIDKIVPGEAVACESTGDAHFYRVRTVYPPDTKHGHLMLGEALNAIPEHIALSACDTDLDAFDPATAAFVDTETTGLAGGTGTMAFLVGVGYFESGAFCLEQCFLRDYDEEEAMLAYLDTLFRRFTAIVSYNGKSFDLPLLRTRFIQNRLPFRLENALHFDLVHAARRFWKRRLQDCALPTIEREVLGVMRHGDVSSAEIPQLWFDYLRTRDARPIERVFYHHQMDILSLVGLTAWLSHCLAAPHGEGFAHAEDRLSLVRLHFRQRKYEEAVAHAQRLFEAETDDALRRECLALLGLAAKRLNEWETAQRAFERLSEEAPADMLARLELAKLHEHRTRDLPAAQRVCQETIAMLEARIARDRATDIDAEHVEAFRLRLERIERKLAKSDWID